MAVSENSTLVDFDADAALTAALEATDDGVFLFVEYTSEGFHTLYADDVTVTLYGDAETMNEHFEEVHSYVHVDFTEQDLFEQLFVGAGGVRSFVTYMDNVVLVRVFADGQGLFFTLGPNADVTPAVEAVEDVIRGQSERAASAEPE